MKNRKVKTFKQLKEYELFTLPNDDKKIVYMKCFNRGEGTMNLCTKDGHVQNFLNDDDIVEKIK